MAQSAALSLQKAFFDLLTAPAFQAACGVSVGIYDRVPQGAVPPYIVISDIQEDGDTVQNYDGSELHANPTIYSSKPGKVELFTIAGNLRATLAPRADASGAVPFVLIDHRLITWKFLQLVPVNEPDGETVKAIAKLVYLTAPLA